MTSPATEKPCLDALRPACEKRADLPDEWRSQAACHAPENGSRAIRRTERQDELPNRGCFFPIPSISDANRKEQQVLRQEALLQLEIAVRLYGYAGAVVTRHEQRDSNEISCIRQACQSLGIPLLVRDAPRLSGQERDGRSDRNARTDSLMLRHGNLSAHLRDTGGVNPGRDVSDTIRRLSDHMAPRIHDQ